MGDNGSFHDAKNRKGKKNKRFQENLVDDNTLFENIQQEHKQTSRADFTFLTESLNKHFFFSNLTPEEVDSAIKKMFYCSVRQGDYIFQQNDSASCFFIISEGEVAVEIDGVEKKHLFAKDGFGEFALLYNSPRSASIRAVQDTRLWAIDRKTFKKVVEDVTTKQFKENREFLEKVPFFESMTDSQKDAIASVLLSQHFKKGEAIINKGDMASSYYIIKSGTAQVIEEDLRVLRDLHDGDAFGEQALYESGHRQASVVAASDVKCLALSRGDLQEILGAKIQQVIQGNWSRWAIERDKILNQLTKVQIEKWIQNSEVKKVRSGDVILDKNKPLSSLIIVINGDLLFGNRTYSKGSLFEASYLYPASNANKK